MKDEEAIQAARTAKRLKEDRKAKNITQDAVSLAMGVGLDHYKKMESGKRPIPLWRLQKLADNDEVDIDVEYVAFGKPRNPNGKDVDVEAEFNDFIRRNQDKQDRLIEVIWAYISRLIKYIKVD